VKQEITLVTFIKYIGAHIFVVLKNLRSAFEDKYVYIGTFKKCKNVHVLLCRKIHFSYFLHRQQLETISLIMVPFLNTDVSISWYECYLTNHNIIIKNHYNNYFYCGHIQL